VKIDKDIAKTGLLKNNSSEQQKVIKILQVTALTQTTLGGLIVFLFVHFS